MKQVKFSEPLARLVLSGTKTTTWRINNEKDIVVGDELSLCHNDGREFANARVTNVRVTTFSELTEDDRSGHETFASDTEMYATYTKYYNFPVTPETNVKVIKFKILV